MTQPIETIRLHGAQLGYSRHGVDAGKPPLVFAHGYGLRATGDLYAELLGPLAQRFAVYALDLRGQGASASAVADWSFEASADDLAAFAAALRLQGPVFVGHSFGALIGAYAEVRHPGTFAALCLLSPGAADERHDSPAALDALIKHGHERDKLRKGFGQMLVHDSDQVLEQVLDAVVLVDADVHRAQKKEARHFNINGDLKHVAAPALVVCGASDSVVDPERQHDMAHRLPHSKEVVFSGEGHMLALERPHVAAREVLAFLDHDVARMAGAHGR